MAKRGEPRGVWPKQLPAETEEQARIRDAFMNAWLDELPQKYGMVENFNHHYPLRSMEAGKTYRTLDIGAGRGEHIRYEDLANQTYYALELRQSLADKIQAHFPDVQTVVGDIQDRLDFEDGAFDRILAVHILEHLPDLPRALDEIKRLLAPEGVFSVLIPCDPGLAYEFARNISARPMFERRFNMSYDWLIALEHINNPPEIIGELEKRFNIVDRTYFPLYIPVPNLNLIIGLTCTHD